MYRQSQLGHRWCRCVFGRCDCIVDKDLETKSRMLVPSRTSSHRFGQDTQIKGSETLLLFMSSRGEGDCKQDVGMES